MASRKEPTPPPGEQHSSGDKPLPGVTFDSAIALSQVGTELGRIANQLGGLANQLGGLDHLERIGDALDNHAELSRIRAALEALVLLTASASEGPAPTLRDAAVIASTRIASLHP